jgi:hypothetical protein
VGLVRRAHGDDLAADDLEAARRHDEPLVGR